jgi:hypothetical protein
MKAATEMINWDKLNTETAEIASRVEGWMLPAEVRALACFGACPTAEGAFIELGSYKGKSTTVLAHASKLTKEPGIVAVDPIEHEQLHINLKREKLDHLVEFHNCSSEEFWKSWAAPIRMLWHDGANHYNLVSDDIRAGLKHLSDGAIVAFHDVRNPSGDRVHNFIDDVLCSPNFGDCGVIGTIGWSQYHTDVVDAVRYQGKKDQLIHSLERLRPYQSLHPKISLDGINKYKYKLLRAMVKREEVTIQRLEQLQ